MFKLNIISQLLGFFMLAVMVNQWSLKLLLALLTILIVLLTLGRTWQILRTIKRFKWFFLVMFTIFAFNTPGEHWANWPFSVSPTYEGVKAGATQTLRIICMLAALSMILANNTKQQLISGFYFILSPLKYLGLTVERFAARLWLTLHYVELNNDEVQRRAKNHNTSLLSRLKTMTDLKVNHDVESDLSVIEFNIPQFRLLDYSVIALLSAAIIKVFV